MKSGAWREGLQREGLVRMVSPARMITGRGQGSTCCRHLAGRSNYLVVPGNRWNCRQDAGSTLQMLPRHHVRLLERESEGFQRHRPVVIQEFHAHSKKVRLGRDAANIV